MLAATKVMVSDKAATTAGMKHRHRWRIVGDGGGQEHIQTPMYTDPKRRVRSTGDQRIGRAGDTTSAQERQAKLLYWTRE